LRLLPTINSNQHAHAWANMSRDDPMSDDVSPPFETVVYVWGNGPPSLPLFRQYGGTSEAARAAAVARGWDPDQADAWAIELTLPARRDLAEMAIRAEARRDPAVMGWVFPDD
jgi:hypothetical protein